ncbi:DUF4407 domain-containing protein [Mycolicibacterium brumae]|nr:DUF4407 domain-containing protein [Mycolicibacterium brumae]MCV7192281.1 DUF4407 domain-containing protein [Mycolicibacterium brumae]UWW10496.1 DUF4407 domain-containing protein [Mycolicibacterium brumae]
MPDHDVSTPEKPPVGRRGVTGRAAILLALGVAAGELAALFLLTGPIDRTLAERAARDVDSAPTVVTASANLDGARANRAQFDEAVESARVRRDEALVTARCEYNPSPECPQTKITGVPGRGPESGTANDLLADAQRELDNALVVRDSAAPALDEAVVVADQALTQARSAAATEVDRSVGARWVAMNSYTAEHPGALLLRLAIVGFFALLSLLPLMLPRWLRDTSHGRNADARAERERAELAADTAIAVKQAQVREAVETMWADQQLANAKMAVAAQTEIDRARHRRRLLEALEQPEAADTLDATEAPAALEAPAAPAQEDDVDRNMYLPIAREAEAASLAAAALPPAGGLSAPVAAPLPARVAESAPAREDRGGLPIPVLPEVTRAAARFIRPLVPPVLAKAIDTTAHPLRTARHAFEEVEEMTFSFRRTRKVTYDTGEAPQAPAQQAVSYAPHPADATGAIPVELQFLRPEPQAAYPTHTHQQPAHQLPPQPAQATPLGAGHAEQTGLGARERDAELTARRQGELPPRTGPRELPPAN